MTRKINSGDVVIFSGAGISAASGIPTFTSADYSIWDEYPIEKYCSFHSWQNNRSAINSFYSMLKRKCEAAQPNNAHLAIRQLYERIGDRLINVTSNVDGLFNRLGIPTIEIHGNLRSVKCIACGTVTGIEEEFSDDFACTRCGSRLVKPNVVFYGETAPEYKFFTKLPKLKYRNLKNITLIVVGSSLNVITADMLRPWDFSKSYLINTDKTEYDSSFSNVIYGRAEIEIPNLISKIA